MGGVGAGFGRGSVSTVFLVEVSGVSLRFSVFFLLSGCLVWLTLRFSGSFRGCCFCGKDWAGFPCLWLCSGPRVFPTGRVPARCASVVLAAVLASGWGRDGAGGAGVVG